MTKVKKTSFKKGEVSNPNGRPKGSMNKLKAASLRLREMASNDIEEAYSILWQDFKDGDSSAKQIFFKELVPFKREWLNEVSTQSIAKTISNTNDISLIIAQLFNKLLEADTMSKEEIHNIIKTLNGIKFSEEFGKLKDSPYSKLSDERILTIKGWFDEANNT